MMSAETFADDHFSPSTSTDLLKRVIAGNQEAWGIRSSDSGKLRAGI